MNNSGGIINEDYVYVSLQVFWSLTEYVVASLAVKDSGIHL